MNRVEFIKRLEMLLEDIPEEERKSALEYYEDYLEEAGNQEEQVIRELGSPERIAAIIKTNLIREVENRESDGEFTEYGYQTPEFDEQPNRIVPHKIQRQEEQRQSAQYSYQTKTNTEENTRDYTSYDTIDSNRRVQKKGTVTIPKIILILLAIVIGFPVILSVAGGVFSLLVGLIVCILSILFSGFLLCACGIFVLALGIAELIMIPINGIYVIGIGLCLLGMGLLISCATIFLWKKALPAIRKFFHKIKNGFKAKRRERQ